MSEALQTWEGQCQCGDIQYKVTGEALTLFACHCTECQKQSSSAFGMGLWVEQESVEISGKDLKSWTRKLPSGREMECLFCPTCGSRLFHHGKGQEDLISIKAGTLNQTNQLQPVAHIWTKSKQPWVQLPDNVLQYPENPENFADMIDAWHESQKKEASA
ncbi:GFA family protein [Leeia sp. TBRC 13508]|uniref:GFA family protein n=1 Tax=Leeia speluncae TaxID=2884804 RepID=A0ABS8D1I9_9NEIS|nr:GFA family protein [Leeia speluncae]MCB6182062.1 GFA family protein [Leeia speluncae]